MPCQVSRPCSPIFSGTRYIGLHPSEFRFRDPTLSPPFWSVGSVPQFLRAQMSGRPRAGRGNRLCQQLLPRQSRFLFTHQPAPGDGSLVALP